jgi:hypothetical protein
LDKEDELKWTKKKALGNYTTKLNYAAKVVEEQRGEKIW